MSDQQLVDPTIDATVKALDTTEMPCRILISNKSAGALIGKQGATIKNIRELSGANISIEQAVPNADKRVVSLKGTIPAITTALRNIVETMSSRNPAEGKADDGNEEGNVTLTLLVSANAVGSLIGQSGATINNTRQTTGASIKISTQPLEGSTEKTVVVSGTSTRVMTAVTHILTQLLSGVIQSGYTDAVARLRPQTPYEPTVSLGLGTVQAATLFAGAGRGLNLGLQGARGARAGRGADLIAAAQLHSQAGATQHQNVVTVSDSVMGAIIGKGGSIISQIRRVSMCDIRVPAKPEGDTSGVRQITITGNAIGVNVATALIEQIVNGTVRGNTTAPVAAVRTHTNLVQGNTTSTNNNNNIAFANGKQY